MSKKNKKPERKQGRPETRTLVINESPEYVAKTIFAASKRPDPSKRKKK